MTHPESTLPSLSIEVVYADPTRNLVRRVEVPAGATVGEAIAQSAITSLLPPGFAPAAVGIFGRVVQTDTRLRDGDRIELYRALSIDPKLARRRRAGA